MRAVLPWHEEELGLVKVELQVLHVLMSARYSEIRVANRVSKGGKRGIVECHLHSSGRRLDSKSLEGRWNQSLIELVRIGCRSRWLGEGRRGIDRVKGC